jgi:hypothetical protein
MKALTKILLDLRLIRFTANRLKNWRIEGNIELLDYALKQGSYDIRKIAIHEIVNLESSDAYDLLINTINDRIRIVSLTAIESLKKIGIKPEHSRMIEQKINYWKYKEIEEQENLKKRNANQKNEVHWERKSNETFENVKQMLKRPMNSGKWF